MSPTPARWRRTLGVEPAQNIAAQANERGIQTLNRFFSSEAAQDIRSSFGQATAVVANNVLAHVDEPRDFLRGCGSLLKDDGRVVIEVPYLRELIERMEYDTVYHEHLCYFSVTALMTLFQNSGLTIQQIDRVPVHGGSLRVYGQRHDVAPDHAAEIHAMALDEKRAGLADVVSYREFSSSVQAGREALVNLLESLRHDGKRLAGYGAPAKGNTLLNYCRIDTRLLPFTVDKNPLKVGMFTPGSHIPVLPVDAILEHDVDFLLILAWNFADEVMRQQQAFRDGGGKFIIPIPTAEIV